MESLPDVMHGDGPAGGTGVAGPPAEACKHCACACHADDVWAAYRVSNTPPCFSDGSMNIYIVYRYQDPMDYRVAKVLEEGIL